ncbi:universal stress protein [Olleya namhaensis]|uniref:universal stress protein n=1 Tax=Olleya namhaensis TaxID=1144750 RepID=UPI0024932E65|nr:universal stress protein [Olleya namhaensis]
MKNILLLTDFSNASKNAIHYAIKILEKQEINFHLVYIHKASAFVSADLMSNATENLYANIIKSPKDDLEDFANQLKSVYKNSNHKFLQHIDYDVFTDAVNQLVELQSIDLIVMGTNGVTGADEVVFGSNTLNVIRKVVCPTLIIPENYEFIKPKQVLIPLDEKDQLSNKRLRYILDIVNKDEAIYHILRITDSDNNTCQDSDTKTLKQLFTTSDYVYHNITNVPMHHVVDTYLQTNDIDFEVFIIQKLSFLERLFSGSPITKHSKIASVPLFILHD